MEEARFIFELVDKSASKPVGGGVAGAQQGSGEGKDTGQGAGERLEERQERAKAAGKPPATQTPAPPASSTPKPPPLPEQPASVAGQAFQGAKDIAGAIPGRFGADAYRMLTSAEAAMDRFGRLADLFKRPEAISVPEAPKPPAVSLPKAEAPKPPAKPTAPEVLGPAGKPPKPDTEAAPWEETSVFRTRDEIAAAQRLAIKNAAMAANAQLGVVVKAATGPATGAVPMGTVAAPPVAGAAAAAPGVAPTAAGSAGMGAMASAAIAYAGPLALAAGMAASLAAARSILLDRSERYGQLSAPVAQARASNDVARTLQDIRLAREYGGNVADFTRATGRLERAMDELATKFGGALAPTVTKLTNATAALTEKLTPLAELGAQGIGLGVQYGTAAGPIADILNALKPAEKVDYGLSVFAWFAAREHLAVPGWDGTEEKIYDELAPQGAAMGGLRL